MESNRCPSTHGVQTWPYIRRCVRPVGHPQTGDDPMAHIDELTHVDGYGEMWPVGGKEDVPVEDLPPTERGPHTVPGEVYRNQTTFTDPQALRDTLTELECGHCGSIHTVQPVTFPEGQRFLCRPCRTEMLSWI